MEEINFTNCMQLPCNYGGSEKKKKILYNGEEYLLKFPDPVREKNKPISYINNVFSEYIGCKIFELLDIPAQKVILGKWIENKDSNTLLKEKIVVACQDFTNDSELLEVSEFSNSITDVDYHFTTDIKDVNYIISKLPENTNKQEFIDRFWDVFVVDTLIGNIDRHLSNWGFILKDNKLFPAPVYDCASSLNPLLSDLEMQEILENKDNNRFKDNVYNIHPVYKYYGKSLTYKEYYNLNLKELNDAFNRIYKKIDLNKINNIIDNTSYMSNIRKEFLKLAIKYRKENILDVYYNNVN